MVKHELLLDSSPNSAISGDLAEERVSFAMGEEESIDFIDPDHHLQATEQKPLLIQDLVGRTCKNNSRRSSTGSNSSTGSSRARHKAGQTSYADMITKAILSTAPDCRMTLSQIYDWMVDHVTGLQEQRSLHSSKGWKNAVRHTLSINPRFKRIQRQGRPGLWMLDVPSLAQRFQHYAIQAGGGVAGQGVLAAAAAAAAATTLTPPIFDANCLVQSADGEFLETDAFRLGSPSSPGSFHMFHSANAMEQHLLNTNYQTINVLNDDGSTGRITLQNPIRIMTKSKSEACTQTEQGNNNVAICTENGLNADRNVTNDHQNVYSKSVANTNSANNTPALSRYYKSEAVSTPYNDPYRWIEQQQQQQQQQQQTNSYQQHNNFLSLPADLQDICLDPSLYCNDSVQDQYWF